MGKRVDFINNSSVITEDWLDDLQELMSRHVSGVRLERLSSNQVRAAIDSQGSIVTDTVSGANKWRYVTVPPVVTVSGGSGTRYLFAVGGADSNPLDPSSNTNKTFSLEASTSSTSGSTNTRLLGTCEWDGSAVSNIRFTAGQQPPADLFNAFVISPNDAGGTPLSLRGFSGQTANYLQVGSSASTTDRLVLDANGRLSLPSTGSTGGLVIGGDTNLYRSAADTLRTADSLVVDSNLTVSGSASLAGSGGSLGFYGASPIPRITGYNVSNVTTDRTYNADSVTINELADVIGTLINDLKNVGVIG